MQLISKYLKKQRFSQKNSRIEVCGTKNAGLATIYNTNPDHAAGLAPIAMEQAKKS